MNALSKSPDGTRVVVAGRDGTLFLIAHAVP